MKDIRQLAEWYRTNIREPERVRRNADFLARKAKQLEALYRVQSPTKRMLRKIKSVEEAIIIGRMPIDR